MKILFLVKLVSFALILGFLIVRPLDFSLLKAEEKENTDATAETKTDGDKKAESDPDDPFNGLLEIPKIDPERVKKEELENYLAQATKLEQQLKDKAKMLVEDKKRLDGVKKELNTLVDKLEEERRFFESAVQKEKELEKERVEALTILYAKMEPKKAAPIFATIDKDLAVELMHRIKKKQVTEILQAMNPEESKELTEYYGRVGSAREYQLLKEMNVTLRQAFDVCKK